MGLALGDEAQALDVLGGAVLVGLGRVVHGEGAVDGAGPVGDARGRVLHLPQPPHVVDLPVVQVEGRVAGGDEEVPAGVAAYVRISCQSMFLLFCSKREDI